MNSGVDLSDNLLVHIGYPKTGSTWLQNHLFDCQAFGLIVPWVNSRLHLSSDFIIQDPYKFNAAKVRMQYQEGLCAARDKGLTAVLSDETLGGDPLRWFVNSRSVAERLKATFPNARILLCIREQKKLILSLYSEYLKLRGLVDLRAFTGADGVQPGRAPFCQLDQLEYDLLIGHYQEQFGKDRVLVLPFEWFVSNKREFVRSILEFVGRNIDCEHLSIPSEVVNPSLGAVSLRVRRFLNRFSAAPDFTYPKQPLSFRVNGKVTSLLDKITPEFINRRYKSKLVALVEAYVGHRYFESNMRTEALTGLDLRKFGYYE